MSILLLDAPAKRPVIEPPAWKPQYVILGTPNTSGRMGARYGVILHGSRSGVARYSLSRGDGSEGRRTLDYVRTPGTTSYNWLIDYDGTIYELAGWDLQAWHAGHTSAPLHMNTNWYGMAFAQADAWEPITPGQHRSTRWLLAEIHERHPGIPLVWRRDVRERYSARGVTEHMATGQGRFGGKSDVGPWLSIKDLGVTV